MKKRIAVISLCILSMMSYSLAVNADELSMQISDEKNFILGNGGSGYDCNSDGDIDVFDAVRMKNEKMKNIPEMTTAPPETSETTVTTVTTTPAETTVTTTSQPAQNEDKYVAPFSDGDVCTFKNVGSGKMLNVHMGNDANDVNVYQWTADGSTEQTFRMNLLSDNSYMIRSMSSSDGKNRTLDIVKSNGNIISGGNVDIYNPTDAIAQQWLFVKISENTYKIVPKYNKALALTSYGNSNGTANGTDSTSAGNVFVSDYVNSANQQWVVEVISSAELTTTTTAETTQPPVTTAPPVVTTEPPAITNPPQTTEKVLPNNAYIDGVTPIVQSGLPTGCEATGLTIALRWYGFNVTKEKMALTYMPRQDFTYVNGRKIGPDFITTFAGDPTRKSNSYGCYIPCMRKTVQNYFDDIGCTDYTTADISGTSLDNLFYYVADGTPVILISTNNLITPTTGDSWYTSDGRYLTWQRGHHCMVLIGYNYSKNEVYISESAYSYIRTYNMDSFRNIYNLKGKNAMIIKKKNGTSTNVPTVSDTYVTPFADGEVYTLKNAGSGKMLNVHMGSDANDVNVYQWTADGSTEQTFRMNLLSDKSYMIRTMCSSDGTNRTLDIVKSNGNIVSGGNVDIYNPTDTVAQRWLFVKTGTNTYKIVPKYNTNLALTAYGNSNGTADGTSSSSAGNVFVSSSTGSAYQQWVLTKVN